MTASTFSMSAQVQAFTLRGLTTSARSTQGPGAKPPAARLERPPACRSDPWRLPSKKERAERPVIGHRSMTTAFWTEQSKHGLELTCEHTRNTEQAEGPHERSFDRRNPSGFSRQGFTRWAVTGSNRRPLRCKRGSSQTRLQQKRLFSLLTVAFRCVVICRGGAWHCPRMRNKCGTRRAPKEG
jgi:hypothetical protein